MSDGFFTPIASYLTSLYPNMSIQDATAFVWIGISDSNSYIGSSNFDYPGGTMTKDDIKGIYSTYVAVLKGTPICN